MIKIVNRDINKLAKWIVLNNRQKKSKKWIFSMKNGGEFKFSKDTEVSLLSTCYGILALNQMGHKFPEKEKKDYIDYILSFKKHDGLIFDENLLKDYDFKNSQHDKEYLTQQMTDFALYCLLILDFKEKLKFKFLEPYKKDIIHWIESLNWKNPWLVTNNVMFMLNFLIYEKEALNNKNSEKLIEQIFEWLQKKQDSKTGFWGSGMDNLNGMAGAFHIIFYYFYLNKKLRYPEKIIETTLSLQREDGHFGRSGGGACIDLDAVDILVKLTKCSDYKKEEIKKALRKIYKSILNSQNWDGGFCENALSSDHYKKEGYPKMKLRKNESDMWSAWFRPLTLALIESTYPELKKTNFKWNFRKNVGLGWHDV